MAIQTKTIVCGSHTISFTYDDARPWTDQDETLEQTYLKLVKSEVDLHAMLYKSIMEYAPIDKEVKSVREFLMLVKDLAKEARDEADNLMLTFMSAEEDDYDRDILTEKVQNAEKAFAEYHVKLSHLEPSIHKVSAFVNKYNELSEEYSLWEELSDIELIHSQNYATNSIDVCTFDDETERFRTYVSVHKDHSDGISRMQDGYVSDYNTLMLQTEMEYGIWNEFVKRLDLLTKMVKVKVPPIISDELNLN